MENFSVNHFPKSRVRLPSSPRHFTPLILSLCSLTLSLSALFEQNPSHPQPITPSHCLLSSLLSFSLAQRRKVSRLRDLGFADLGRRGFAIWGFATRFADLGFAVGFGKRLRRSGASRRGGLWVRWVCGVCWDCGFLL